MLQRLIGREGFFFFSSRVVAASILQMNGRNRITGPAKYYRKKREKNEKVKKGITESSFGECTKARAQPDYGHYVVFFNLSSYVKKISIR